MKVAKLLAAWAAAVVGAAACGADPAPATGDGTGTIRLALQSTAGSTTYVLANATFLVERVQPPPGPGEITGVRLHQSDPTAGDLTSTFDVGRYTVTLLDGWQLEREDSPTTLVPLYATLLTPNPVTVSVFNGQTSAVTFRFETSGLPIAIGPGSGTIDIGVGVSTCDTGAPPDFAENLVVDPGFEEDANGWRSPTGTLSRSSIAHCGRHSLQSSDGVFVWTPPTGLSAGDYAISFMVRSDTPVNLVSGIVDLDPFSTCPARQGSTLAISGGEWWHISGTPTAIEGCSRQAFKLSANASTLLDDVYVIPQ